MGYNRFPCDPVHAGFGGVSGTPPGQPGAMFFFFSNRLGCLGSIIISLLITGILLLLLGIL